MKQKNDSPGPGHYVVKEGLTTKKKITTFPKMEKKTIFWIEENDLGPGRYLPLNGEGEKIPREGEDSIRTFTTSPRTKDFNKAVVQLHLEQKINRHLMQS